MFQPSVFFIISLRELRKRGNKLNKLLFKLMIQQLVKIQLCSLYCGNTHYPGLWRMTLSYMVRHLNLFQTVSAQPQMSVLTSCCSLRTCTVLPQIQLEQQRRVVSVCCVHVGCMDGYIHNKKCVCRCVCVCLHLLSYGLYAQSMSKRGHV